MSCVVHFAAVVASFILGYFGCKKLLALLWLIECTYITIDKLVFFILVLAFGGLSGLVEFAAIIYLLLAVSKIMYYCLGRVTNTLYYAARYDKTNLLRLLYITLKYLIKVKRL